MITHCVKLFIALVKNVLSNKITKYYGNSSFVKCLLLKERQLILEEYSELASRLRSWLTEATAEMLQRDFSTSASQMKASVHSFMIKEIALFHFNA